MELGSFPPVTLLNLLLGARGLSSAELIEEVEEIGRNGIRFSNPPAPIREQLLRGLRIDTSRLSILPQKELQVES